MSKHVLICNDDGIQSPGLRTLADAFWASGWRVSVCAPSSQRSAASRSFTVARPLLQSKVEWKNIPEKDADHIWQCDGTPADCARLALSCLCGEKPDLVCSGINDGWNIGIDIYYSGTVGAAMEGAIMDCPALAVSVRNPNQKKNEYAAMQAVRVAEAMMKHSMPADTVMNLNLPDCEPEEIKGIAEAELCRLRYNREYGKLAHPEYQNAYWLHMTIDNACAKEGTDLWYLLNHTATLSVLRWDMPVPHAAKDILGEL